MNFGYASGSQPDHSRVALPRHCLNKNGIRLVCELVGYCPLEGCEVLDVGCGRGGTIHVLNQYFAPARTVGIDLSLEAIGFCRQTHASARIEFVHGDAEHLPFPDNAFDVVTNVESSHSYPSLERFYRETHRVLRAGGRFLYTDLLAKDRWLSALAILENLGFTTEVARDITENVLLSCDETGRRHLQSFRRENDAELMAEFLGLSGSATYEGMKRGASSYRIYRLSAAKGMSRECLALSGVPATARHELSVV